MNAEFINPFLKAMINILATMADMKCTPGKAYLKKSTSPGGQVTGIIGMASEQVKGSFAITFSEPVILDITERMLGEAITTIDATVTDMVGEITNMATGGAKAQLAEKGYDFNMATPVVVSGEGHKIEHSSNGPIIVVPFTTDAGDFFIEISFITV